MDPPPACLRIGPRTIPPAVRRQGRLAFPLRLPLSLGPLLSAAPAPAALSLLTPDLHLDLPPASLVPEAGGLRLPAPPFRALRGPAVLLARLPEEAAEEPWPILFLAGDSYPRDRRVQEALLAALAPLLGEGGILRQDDPGGGGMLRHDDPGGGGIPGRDDPGGAAPRPPRIAERLPALLRRLDALPGDGAARALLIGRSSGARVATLAATRRPVRAVIGLGYPFRAPRRPEEPARYAHLARLRVPTLILQGRQDAYGGPEAALARPLSRAVALGALEADHGLALSPAGWAAVARRILLFLAFLPPASPPGE